MPNPSVLSPLGLAMQAQLPPQLRSSYDYLAVINALAKECELLEASIEIVRAQFDPATADVLLDAWEWQLKLPVGGAGAGIAERQARVITRLRKVLSGGEGREWEQTISSIVGAGWSYLEHIINAPVNLVTEPDFSHVSTGSPPVKWLGTVRGPIVASPTSRVVTNNSPTDNLLTVTCPASSSPVGVSIALGDVAAGETVTANVHLESGKAGQVLQIELEDNSLGNGPAASPATVFATTGLTQWLSVSWTPTADSANAMLYVFTTSALAGDVFSLRESIVSPGAEIPAWFSGDTPGNSWAGVAGQSTSALDSPADGVIQITVPFASGSSEFIEAENQIRDITDAHLAIQFQSSAEFQLDISQLDESEFGA